MTLKVIGAGFGRTGTLSLKFALERLGFGPCYHMVEVNAHPEHDPAWLALARGEPGDWRVLRGYASTVDWPSTYFWRELAAANPEAKVILTTRDPEAWYDSASATIFARMLEFEVLRTEVLRTEALRAKALGAKALGAKALRAGDNVDTLDPLRQRHMQMVNFIVVEKTFGGSLDKAHALRVFEAHNEAVRRTIPPERLLVYESGQGWEPLCAFLGVPVPSAPYPKVNTSDNFTARFPDRR